jgi:hypothetical protein
MTTVADPATDAFIHKLASITDEAERARLIARVKMRAMDLAPDEAFQPDVTRLREYLAKPIPIPPSLVWPTIAVRGEITTTLGRAGKGKTTMNLNRIFAWACGRPLFPDWTDHDGNIYLNPEKPLRTLIAENEGNAGMFHQKVGLLLHQGPLTEDEREMCLDNLYVHGDGGYSGMKLDNDEGVKKLRRAIESIDGGPPDIVFIEPFRSLWRGEENSSTDMAVVVDNMVAIATDYNCAIILSHHAKKNSSEDGEKMSDARGSTVLEGIVAVMENFESVKDGEYREMTWSKARYLAPPTPVRMGWDRETGWYEWVPTSAIADGVIAALREADDEPMNLSDIAEVTGETKSKLRPVMKNLEEEKRVKKMPSVQQPGGGTSGTRWRLPSGDSDPGAGGLAL